MLDYRVQRCQITEVFYTKVLVNDILVRLERILDYAGVGLERFNCKHFKMIQNNLEIDKGDCSIIRVFHQLLYVLLE